MAAIFHKLSFIFGRPSLFWLIQCIAILVLCCAVLLSCRLLWDRFVERTTTTTTTATTAATATVAAASTKTAPYYTFDSIRLHSCSCTFVRALNPSISLCVSVSVSISFVLTSIFEQVLFSHVYDSCTLPCQIERDFKNVFEFASA